MFHKKYVWRGLVWQLIITLLVAIALIGFIAPFDWKVINFIDTKYSPWGANISKVLTEYVIYILMCFVYFWCLWEWYSQRSYRLYPLVCTILLALLIGTIGKYVFDLPRPFYTDQSLTPLVTAHAPSFPSNHAAIAFAFVVPLFRIARRLGYFALLFAISIAFCRVYQLVHFPTDVIAGAFIGIFTGLLLSHPLFIKKIKEVWKSKEFRRQFVHFWFGVGCILFHWFLGDIMILLFSLAVGGGILLSILVRHVRVPLISEALDTFERDQDRKEFPGRGLIYFVMGVAIVLYFFENNIAYASIMILSAGDSLNHLYNRITKYKKLPWNNRKNWRGIAFGTLMGTLFSMGFVGFTPALLVSFVALILESIPIRLWHLYLNDNIFVPIVSALLLSMTF